MPDNYQINHSHHNQSYYASIPQQTENLSAKYIRSQVKPFLFYLLSMFSIGPIDLPKFDSHDQSEHEKSELPQKQQLLPTIRYQQKLSLFLNHEVYNLLMAILTIYSIFAIDIQKSFFNQPAAYIFGYVHIIAICVFSTEMILNWLGKEKYPLSFYFWIDVISTMSMVLQITWVDNFLVDNSNLPGVLTIAKVIKASRLSKIGGRAAKIILLFLNYLKNKKAEEEKNRTKDMKNTESVVNDSIFKTQTAIESKLKSQIDYEAEEEVSNLELINELPKKYDANRHELDRISEEKMTERSSVEDDNYRTKQPQKISKFLKVKESVIVTALLGKRRSKSIRNSENNFVKKKPDKRIYQITNIVERLQQTFKLQPLPRSKVSAQKSEQIERKWRQVCQRQEQQRNQARQKIKSNKQNFKLGQTLKQKIQKNIIIMIMSLIIILPLISADTWFNKDPTIDQLMENYITIANNITDNVTLTYYLAQVVENSFQSSSPIVYMSVTTPLGTYVYPDDFPTLTAPVVPLSDYMQPEKITAEGEGYSIIFNARDISQITANINLVRSCFITVLLIFSTIIFMYSIENNALAPLQKMCISINKISINPFDALKEVNDKKEDIEVSKPNDLETNILERAIWKMTNLLVIGAGQIGSELISSKVDELNSSSSLYFLEGTKIHGVFMCLKIANYQKICEYYNDDLLAYINKFAMQIHEIVVRNGGLLIEDDGPTFLVYWKTPEDINIELETTKYFMSNNPLKTLGKTVQTQRIIQLALRSFLQISIALSEFNKKRFEQPTHQKQEQQFETFVVEAGIHLGDGYQGSIGSNMKIEVKSISSDIEYTKKLCVLAGKYKLSNLISHQVCEILDDLENNYVRKIDYVKQKVSGDIYWIYTHDFSLLPVIDPEKFDHKIKKKKRNKKATIRTSKDKEYIYKKRSELLQKLKSEPLEVILPLLTSEKQCQKMFNPTFYETWNEGLDRFYQNEWEEAACLFEAMHEYHFTGFKDIMASHLINRMISLGGEPPQQWEKINIISIE